MPSRIDDSRPLDGVPASKADLRASLAAAKSELEHGGFFMAAATGAVERTVQETLREVVSVNDFGAVGDGVTDDAPAVRAALDAAAGGGKVLVFPNGVYLLNSWTPYTPPGALFLRGHPGSVIKAANVAPEAIHIDNVDVNLSGLTFQNFNVLLRFYPHEHSFTECILRDCAFIDVTKTLFNSRTVGGGLKTLQVESCLFQGYSRAIQIQSGEVRRAIVVNNRFLNGGADSFFVGTNAEIGEVTKQHFIIIGNIFDGATAREEEAHYVRCYGEYAVISNNIFANLNSEDPKPNDVEAVYPKCRHTLITGNVFVNAGIGRGFISLKGSSSHTVIANNEFRTTKDHIERYPSNKVVAIFVDSPTNITIANNQFNGFANDIIQTGSQNLRELKIHENSFYDCPCKNVINLVGAANVEISHNSIFDGGGGTPATFVFIGDSGAEASTVRIVNNSISTTDKAIAAKSQDARRHEIDIVGNHFRTCAQVFEKSSKPNAGRFRFINNRVDEVTEGWWHTSSNTPLADRIEIRDNAWPEVWTTHADTHLVERLPLPEPAAVRVEWRAVARELDASDSAFYRIERLYRRVDGTLGQVGSDARRDALASNPTWGGVSVDGGESSLLFQVRGAEATTIGWSCDLTVEVL